MKIKYLVNALGTDLDLEGPRESLRFRNGPAHVSSIPGFNLYMMLMMVPNRRIIYDQAAFKFCGKRCS